MSYGTAAQVAALTRRYTNSGTYDATSNPTKTTVDDWLATVSADLDTSLAAAGFTLPITQATVLVLLAGVAVEKVADLCHAANSAGRFFTEKAVANGISPMMAIRREMKQWVEENAAGMKALGAAMNATLDDRRSNTLTAGVIGMDIAEHDDLTSSVETY